MALAHHRRPKAATPAKSAQGLAATHKFYAFEVPGAVTQSLGVKMPSDAWLAFVVTSRAAGKKLKTREIGTVERVLPAQRGQSSTYIEVSAFEPGSRARALLLGKKIAEADLREAGGTYDLQNVQDLLNGVSRQALEKRVKEGSLLAVPGPSNRRRYPVVQFTNHGIVPGLKQVRDALPTRDPWAILNFLVRPDDRLGGRKPIEVLREGDVDLVVSAARAMGMQGG